MKTSEPSSFASFVWSVVVVVWCPSFPALETTTTALFAFIEIVATSRYHLFYLLGQVFGFFIAFNQTNGRLFSIVQFQFTVLQFFDQRFAGILFG